MNYRHLFLIFAFSIALTGCQTKPSSDTKPVEKGNKEAQAEEIAKKADDCTISPIPKGWKCFNYKPEFSILLPLDFQSYAQSINFFSSTRSYFIHTGYFPLRAFAEESQKLLQEGKLKEYMEYEQKEACPPEKPCKTELIPESMTYLTLGDNRFLKYEVELKDKDVSSKTKHYASLINNSLIDFSSTEDEKVPNPPGSENVINSKKLEDKLFEEILTTLKADKKN